MATTPRPARRSRRPPPPPARSLCRSIRARTPSRTIRLSSARKTLMTGPGVVARRAMISQLSHIRAGAAQGAGTPRPVVPATPATRGDHLVPGRCGGPQSGAMRIESSVTSLSWIPSEAVRGGTRVAFDAGITHYDEPPPDVDRGPRGAAGQADRFRFANRPLGLDGGRRHRPDHRLRLLGGGLMGSTTVGVGPLNHDSRPWPCPTSSARPSSGTGGSASSRPPAAAPGCPPPGGSAAPAVRPVAGPAGVDHPAASPCTPTGAPSSR